MPYCRRAISPFQFMSHFAQICWKHLETYSGNLEINNYVWENGAFSVEEHQIRAMSPPLTCILAGPHSSSEDWSYDLMWWFLFFLSWRSRNMILSTGISLRQEACSETYMSPMNFPQCCGGLLINCALVNNPQIYWDQEQTGKYPFRYKVKSGIRKYCLNFPIGVDGL